MGGEGGKKLFELVICLVKEDPSMIFARLIFKRMNENIFSSATFILAYLIYSLNLFFDHTTHNTQKQQRKHPPPHSSKNQQQCGVVDVVRCCWSCWWWFWWREKGGMGGDGGEEYGGR